MKARKSKGWKLLEAAEKLGVVKSQVWHWENGTYLPGKTNLELLARVYGLKYERLVRIASAERYS